MKSEVVNTDIAPSWFPSETPEERVYWFSGYTLIDDEPHDGTWTVHVSERAAWRVRESVAKDPSYLPETDAPFSMTKTQILEASGREKDISKILVKDEHGNIVEEWTV